MKITDIDFQKTNGLIPVIIQNKTDGVVLMLGYMNREALTKTLKKGLVYFWSRSRQKLWMKGKKSGNKFKVTEIYSDCDKDALLVKVNLLGRNACHTGSKTCFYTKLL